MKKIVMILLSVLTIAFGTFTIVRPVMAENKLTEKACEAADEQQKAALGCDTNDQAPSVITFILNGVISIVGILAVGMLVVAGQRYITSSGDPGKVQQAKDMIVYSLVGVVIALLAFAVVNFVLGGIFGAQS